MTARLRLIAINAVILVAMLLVIEGLASYRNFFALSLSDDRAEARHTRYDPELGWVNIPGMRVPDMYGPGIGLTINDQGFRHEGTVPARVPDGRIRVVCSGDSFTLGYGVSDADAWCQRLTALDPRLDTVNMGQGGYGADQAFLWYQRDGTRFDHHLQLFAFILEDFARVESTDSWGHRKPLLVIEHDRLAVTRTPVPGPRNFTFRRFWDQLDELESVSLARRIGDRVLPGSFEVAHRHDSPDQTRAVVRMMLMELQRLNRERASQLVLIHLPDGRDLSDPDGWLAFVEQQAHTLGIPMFTLQEAFAALPPHQAAKMFIGEGEVPYEGAAGHYSSAGNSFVAGLIYERVKALLVAN